MSELPGRELTSGEIDLNQYDAHAFVSIGRLWAFLLFVGALLMIGSVQIRPGDANFTTYLIMWGVWLALAVFVLYVRALPARKRLVMAVGKPGLLWRPIPALLRFRQVMWSELTDLRPSTIHWHLGPISTPLASRSIMPIWLDDAQNGILDRLGRGRSINLTFADQRPEVMVAHARPYLPSYAASHGD